MRSSTGLALVLLAAGCTEPTQPVRDVVLDVERVAWDQSDLTVTYLASNATGDSVLVGPACGGRVGGLLEQQTAAGWQVIAGGQCQAIHDMGPVRLADGGRLQATLGVSRLAEGWYRLRLNYSLFSGRAVERNAFSEPFELRE